MRHVTRFVALAFMVFEIRQFSPTLLKKGIRYRVLMSTPKMLRKSLFMERAVSPTYFSLTKLMVSHDLQCSTVTNQIAFD